MENEIRVDERTGVVRHDPRWLGECAWCIRYPDEPIARYQNQPVHCHRHGSYTSCFVHFSLLSPHGGCPWCSAIREHNSAIRAKREKAS